MKTLGEIVEACQDGEKPTIDEARFAICAMSSLMTFDSMLLRRLAGYEMESRSPGVFTAERNYEEQFNRVKKAMATSPDKWLGPNNDPDSEGVQRRRKVSRKLLDKALEKYTSKED